MKKSVYLVIALLMTILACSSCAKQKAAEETLIIYTIYNRTGESITRLALSDAKGSSATEVKHFPNGYPNGTGVQLGINAVTDENGLPNLKLTYETESGYQCEVTVSQKDTPVMLLPAESGEEISLHTPQE